MNDPATPPGPDQPRRRPAIFPCNQKARQLAALVLAQRGTARALTHDPPPTQYPYGCTTIFAPACSPSDSDSPFDFMMTSAGTPKRRDKL